MTINAEELRIFIDVLKRQLKNKKLDIHDRIVMERMQHKFECLLNTIETGGMGE